VGQYPSGVIDWPQHEWKIGTPGGKFGTFNLIADDVDAGKLEFSFPSPRVFAGVDVYNGGASEADISIQTAGAPDVAINLKPGELRRVRTGWSEACSQVTFTLQHGDGLRFDNLAYLHD